MQSRLFTLAEANRILPLVRSITGEAVACYRQAKESIAALEVLKAAPGSPRAGEELDRRDAEVAHHLRQLQRLVGELEALGCRLRDYERGSVDFPAALVAEQGFVVWCWALGEPEVAHWHAEDEGYDARRALSADAA